MEFLDEIQNWIDDSKVVTYRTVAYFLDVHVNTAKMMLFTYYNQNEKNLDAVYWIFGKLSQDKGMKATLTTQKKRKLVEESFDSIISEHLYAIAKSSSQEFDVTDIYKAETEIRKTQRELGQNSGLKPSLRGIKNNNCSIIKKNIVHQSVKETPKVSAEVSATDTKPSTQEQESKKNGKSKSTKGGKSAISDMFSKKSSKATENTTKTEVNSEVKPKPSQEKEVIKAKSNGLKGKFPSQAISEMFAKAPPKKKTDSQEYNVEKDDVSPGKENSENNLPRNKDAKMRTISKKREKSQTDETSNSKRRKRIQVMSSSDSSDSEEEDEIEKVKPTPNFEDLIPSPVKNEKEVSEDEHEIIPDTPQQEKNSKRRGRKLVNKTYVDEGGFMVTKKVYESCSEEEKEEVEEKKSTNIQINNKTIPNTDSVSKASSSSGAKKQASIKNFFTKK